MSTKDSVVKSLSSAAVSLRFAKRSKDQASCCRDGVHYEEDQE
jgi:hypothetical protein